MAARNPHAVVVASCTQELPRSAQGAFDIGQRDCRDDPSRPRLEGAPVVNALGVTLRVIRNGWAVELTDGRELARFTGPWAKRRALRYLATKNLPATVSEPTEAGR